MSDQLDADATERVLGRALELHEAHHPPAAATVDEDAVLRAAAEVGIPVHSVSESLAIERLGDSPETRVLDVIVGAHEVTIERRLEMAAHDALEVVDRWLVVGHHLRRQRTTASSRTWRKRVDAVALAQRSTRRLAGNARLGHVRTVAAHAESFLGPDGESMCLLRVTIDRSGDRTKKLAVSTTLASGGTAAAVLGAAGVILMSPVVLVVGATTVGSAIVARSSRREADSLEHELHRLLDDIEHGRPPRRVSAELLRRLTPRGRRSRR